MKKNKNTQKRLLLTSEKVRDLQPLKTVQLGVVVGAADTETDCSWTTKTCFQSYGC
jgi:hypothetical protein